MAAHQLSPNEILSKIRMFDEYGHTQIGNSLPAVKDLSKVLKDISSSTSISQKTLSPIKEPTLDSKQAFKFETPNEGSNTTYIKRDGSVERKAA